jgi:hypothetical protein
MSDNMEPMLRNALDAVSTGRKWTLLGIAALFVAVTLMLAFLFMLFPTLDQGVARDALPEGTQSIAGNTMPLKVIYVSSAAEMLLIACGTAVVMLHISRMTRIILRAIESTRR